MKGSLHRIRNNGCGKSTQLDAFSVLGESNYSVKTPVVKPIHKDISASIQHVYMIMHMHLSSIAC